MYVMLCLYVFVYLYNLYNENIKYLSWIYSTCRFSQLFDLEMSLRQIFCRISLAKWSDMCVRELRIFIALCAAAFLSRVSFKRIWARWEMVERRKEKNNVKETKKRQRGKKRTRKNIVQI